MKGINFNRSGFRLTVFRLVSVVTLLLFSSQTVFALPSGQQVVNGQADFSTQGSSLTITNSPNAIIQWQGFSIGANEAVRFLQQSASSAVLNRVIGQDPSRILGLLQSNGRVFLINPNGILFGQGARIDVNGLVASTLNLSNADFLAGKYNFTSTEGAPAGAIRNQGTIATPSGGKVYLIAPEVENTGLIHTPQGEVILAAGRSVHLVDSANPDIAVVVSAPQDAAVNLGQVIAQSGQVGIYGGMISQQGTVSADSAMVGENGRIFFRASNSITLGAGSTTSASGPEGGQIAIRSETGTTLVSGAVAARGSEGPGGEIQVLGRQVGLIGDARIDASGATGGGTVLIGGDDQGSNPNVQNAEAVFIGPDAAICADATEAGDGGKVVVWSDHATRVYGAISAKGGIFSGNGGYVETSGSYLDITRAPDLSAPRGTSGEWLLDPNNITIQAAGSNYQVTNAPDFTTTDDNAIITTGSIATALNAGSNVSIVTGSQGADSQPGNITVADPVTWTTDSTLTLKAHQDIAVNAPITSSAAAGKLILRADSDADGAGTVTFGGAVGAGGGSIDMGASGTVSIYYNPTNYLAATYDADVVNFNSRVTAAVKNYYMLVNTLDNLQALNTNLAGVYALGKNIDATATTGWNDGAGFVPIGESDNPFYGVFEGDGHFIGNLFINRPATDYVGLFGITNISVIRNLGLLGGSVTGYWLVGGLAGYNGGAITNAYNTGNVTGSAGSEGIGGLAGWNSGAISNSYNTGNVTGWSTIGGLAGHNEGSVDYSYNSGNVSGNDRIGGLAGRNYGAISNSYNTGDVTGTSVAGSLAGGLVGRNWAPGNISDCYSSGNVTGNSYFGGLIGQKDGGTISNSYWDTTTAGVDVQYGIGFDVTAVPPAPGNTGATGLTTSQFMTQATFTGWDFANTWWMSDTNTRPFLRSEYRTEITNAHQLQLMALNLGATYSLGTNLDLAELMQVSGLWNTATGFVPVGSSSNPFTGTVDGNSHTITGLNINRPLNDYVGLFGFTADTASIRNVGLMNMNVAGYTYVGGLAGWNNAAIDSSYSSGTINGVSYIGGLVGFGSGGNISASYNGATVSGAGSSIGGLVGYYGPGLTITNANSTGAVSGTGDWSSNVGGLVGENSGTIINAYSTGAVTSTGRYSLDGRSRVGGLVGRNSGTIENSYHTAGTVTAAYPYVGGLVGHNLGSVTTGSYNAAAVNGPADVGGLVGYNTGTISDSYNMGWVTGTGWYVGGLTGENFGGTILRSCNTGAVSGTTNVGGLVGDNYNTITDSYNTGTVVGESSVGGLVGYQDSGSSITGSYSSGEVVGTSSVGGLVGTSWGTITGSYSTGLADGASYVGGLVGSSISGGVSKSYSTGAVSGNYAVGGLVGENQSIITNAYSTGSVTGTGLGQERIGGLVGNNNGGTVSYTYSAGTVNAAGDATNVGGLAGRNSEGTITNSYWNTETSGKDTSAGGIGLTTAQMTTLASFGGWDFATIWGMTAGTTYPYLQGQALPYPAPGPPPPQQTISGWLETAVPGKTIYFVVDGALRPETAITTAGDVGTVFSVSLPENTVSTGHSLLAFVYGDGSYKGATVYLASGGDITGLLISYYTLTASGGGTMSNTTLGTAKGALTSTDIPYIVANSNLTLSDGFSFQVASGTNYLLDGNITTTNGSQTYNGPVTLAANAVLASIGGSITLNAPLNAGAYGLTLSGGGVETGGVVLNGGLTSSGSVTMESSNDIDIASPITAGSLVLRADAEGDGTGTVNFTGSGSVAITGGGAASIFYNPPDGYASPTDYTAYFTGVTPTAYMLVNDVGPEAPSSTDRGLQAIQNNLSGTYALGKDIDASATAGWNAGAGFDPIGTFSAGQEFTGVFDGLGHTITGLNINRGGESFVGLFGSATDAAVAATIVNVGLVNVNITGDFQTGGLLGRATGTISNCYVTGTVTGGQTVGGLVGLNAGSISNSYSTASVSGDIYVGGLVGANYQPSATIVNSYSTGLISAPDQKGGLSGYNYVGGPITGSYWNTETSGQSSSAGGTGLTTAQMTTPASFSGWDFTNTWGIAEGTTYPYLLWQPSGTYPTPPGVQPPDHITPGLITPEIFGNTIAAGDTVVALLTVTEAIFSPDAVIPENPFASERAGSASPADSASPRSQDGGISGETEEEDPSTETTTASEEETARSEAARLIGGLKKDARPDDEKVQIYCN